MTTQHITFRTRKWAEPADHGAGGASLGGSRPRWTDEESAIHAIVRPGNRRAVRERGH